MPKKTNVYLPQKLHLRAKVKAAHSGVSLSQLVVLALELYLKGTTNK